MADVKELRERIKWAEEVPGFTLDGKPAYVFQIEEARALLDRLEAAERERDEALNEHTDMMYQRQHADERAEAAEARLLPPVLTHEQREKLARALIEWKYNKVWDELDEEDKQECLADADRFHATLTRIEGEKR